MRRVQSAPANLASMTHEQKSSKVESYTPLEKTITAVHPLQHIKRDDAMNEIVSVIAAEARVSDSTEQLLFVMVVKKMVSRESGLTTSVLQEAALRLFTTFVTHQVMTFALTILHGNGPPPPHIT